MKLNRSLGISQKLQELSASSLLQSLESEFPEDLLSQSLNSPKGRSRVFTPLSTLLTMVLAATQKDKSLQNSVDLFYTIHQQHRHKKLEDLAIEKQKQLQAYSALPRKAGRPMKFEVSIPKSLSEDISLNTAAYSKARDRLPMELVNRLFEGSRLTNAHNDYSHFHGYKVYIGDGTYFQMQDTEPIRNQYEVKHDGIGSAGYPQGLLVAVIERGTGQIYNFGISNRHVSELTLMYGMLDSIPIKSILLLDDLYNCYEIISKCKRKEIEIVVPAKRERSYEVVEVIEKGDEIIKIKTPKNRSKWLEENEPAGSIVLRRIVCKSPEGKEYILHTTLLDKGIDKQEIQALYLTRWDIEIGIREIKTVMDINILRSKTPEMAVKELTVSLATYNLLRRLIYASIKDLPFSPKEDFIYQFYQNNQSVLIDKKGRVYSKWSTGRRRTTSNHQERDPSKAKT
jgi:hypothetical protein